MIEFQRRAEVRDRKIKLPVHMIVLSALDQNTFIIGFQAESRGEVGERVVAQKAPVVMPIESVGNQAFGGVFTSAAFTGNELIVDRQITGGECLSEQLNGFVANTLLSRCT